MCLILLPENEKVGQLKKFASCTDDSLHGKADSLEMLSAHQTQGVREHHLAEKDDGLFLSKALRVCSLLLESWPLLQ